MPLTPNLTKFTTTNPVMVNYDWTDIASGLGYETFYGLKLSNGGYMLINNKITAGYASDNDWLWKKENTASNSISLQTNEFGSSRTIKGTLFLSYNLYHSITTLTITIYKNTTQIATKTLQKGSASVVNLLNDTIEIPETIFNKGDYFKIGLSYTGTTYSHIGMGFNPGGESRTGFGQNYEYTYFKLLIPFKLDI